MEWDLITVSMEGLLMTACEEGDFSRALELLSQGADPKLARDRDGWTPLHLACMNGNLSFIKTLVEKHSCDLECRTFHNSWIYGIDAGATPLHVACSCGRLEVVKFLTSEQHCNLESSDKDGQTPLHLACLWGTLEVVKFLTSEQQCNLESSDGNGHTPLHLACQEGHLEVVRYLTSVQHCNLESSDGDGRTPLHLACWEGCLEVVRYLTSEQHCNLVGSDGYGCTPLHLACWWGHLEVVRYLISEQHCNLESSDEHGCTPLHLACRWGHLEVVKFLMSEQHCNLESSDKDGYTPFHLACRKRHFEIVWYLIKDQHCSAKLGLSAAKDLLSWANREGVLQQLTFEHHGSIILESGVVEALLLWASWMLLKLLLWASKEGRLKIVRYLTSEQQCNLESSDKDGQTPLHLACREGRLEVVRYLTSKQHCNLESSNWYGHTPLHLACLYDHLEVVKYLIHEQHCNLESNDEDGHTPLHLACQEGCLEVVRYLTSTQHCDLESSDKYGRTPLHLACLWGHLEVVKYLTSDQHCNIESTDEDRNTPLHLACRMQHFEIAWYLIMDKYCSAKLRLFAARGLLTWANREGVLQQLTSEHHDGIILEKSDAKALLLWASENGHVKIVHYLLTEKGCDANCTTEDGLTPLSVSNNPSIIQELLQHGANPENVYAQYGSHLPEHSPKQPKEAAVKTFTVGDSGAGKTTLVKALEREGKGLSRISNWLIKVSGINQKTAGIIPHRVESRTFGHIVLYDFAGHKEFYGSHAAMIRQSMTGSSAAIFLLLSDLRSSDEDFKSSILSWLSFIDNQCSSVDPRPHIIIVGSHADEIKSRAEIAKKSSIVHSLVPTTAFASLQFIGYVTINCCYSESTSISELRQHIARSCEALRITSQLNFNTHCFLLYLLDKYQDCEAVKLEEVLTKVRESSTQAATESNSTALLSFIPIQFPERLHKMCEDLHDRGSILLLRNAGKPKESWIILDQVALLSHVTGTVFAPEGFKQHRDLASSTGVVPFSKLQTHFPNLDPDMVAQFLCHLEFCQVVTDHEVLQLLQMSDAPLSTEERVFFFPALVSIDAPGVKPVAIAQIADQISPTKVWKPSDDFVYHSGWILQCSEPEHFFTPRFLQVLLLRLAFSFALIPDTQEIKKDLPSIQRKCDVWKSGISWHNRSGVGALVEMNQSKTVNVLLRCLKGREIECIHLRSAIIHKALCAREEFCPKVSTSEYFIHPTDAIQYPLKPTFELFSISKISRAIAAAKPCVIGKDWLPLNLEKLLYFEPYIHLSVTVLQKLFDEQQSSCEEVTDQFLYQIAQCAHSKPKYFFKMFSMFEPPVHTIEATSPSSIIQLFQLWRLRSRMGSYQCLRRELDQFSVFAGRNPLDPISPSISPLPIAVATSEVDSTTLNYSRILQDVDETTLGITSLLEVRAELKEATSFWVELGLACGLPQHTLETVKQENQADIGQCLTETLAAWLQKRDSVAIPNWKTIVKALLNPAINFYRLALRIANTHCHERSDSHFSNTAIVDHMVQYVEDDYLDDSSLGVVKSALLVGGGHLSWFHLGLTLGLYYGSLKEIQVNGDTYKEHLTATLEAWLSQKDRVPQQGLPSWRSLTTALAHPLVSQQGLAEEIARKHQKEEANQVVDTFESDTSEYDTCDSDIYESCKSDTCESGSAEAESGTSSRHI